MFSQRPGEKQGERLFSNGGLQGKGLLILLDTQTIYIDGGYHIMRKGIRS